MVSKDTLRREAMRHRNRIDPGSEDADAATGRFFNAIKPQPGQAVASYWPKGREFDPGGIVERLLAEGMVCALPVVARDSLILRFARWDEQTPMEEGPFNIAQPVVNEQTHWLEPDIVIVPLLAFDRRGNRLGYGGGYYDATIEALRATRAIVTVGVGYAQQAVLFNLPAEAHDQKLDWVITPLHAHCFCD